MRANRECFGRMAMDFCTGARRENSTTATAKLHDGKEGLMLVVPYIRSSAMASIDLCEHSYFLSYGLAERSGTNLNAAKGTVCHKIMELLAQCKLFFQQEKEQFI